MRCAPCASAWARASHWCSNGSRSLGGRRPTPQKVAISGVLDPLPSSRKSLLSDSERSKFGWPLSNPSAAQTPRARRGCGLRCAPPSAGRERAGNVGTPATPRPAGHQRLAHAHHHPAQASHSSRSSQASQASQAHQASDAVEGHRWRMRNLQFSATARCAFLSAKAAPRLNTGPACRACLNGCGIARMTVAVRVPRPAQSVCLCGVQAGGPCSRLKPSSPAPPR